jgi:predicted dehydrogenase
LSDPPTRQNSSPVPPLLIVGCGRIVEFAHAPALAGNAQAEVIGLVDPAPERRAAIARLLTQREMGAVGYTSLADAPVMDSIVLVAVPSHLRAGIVISLLNEAQGVVVEKPLAIQAAEAQSILDVARTRHRHLVPVHNWRYDPAMRRLAELCASGRLGVVRHIRYDHHMMQPLRGAWPANPDWREQVAGGCVADLAYHACYLAEEVSGQAIIESRCLARRWDDGVLVAAEVLLRGDDGVRGEVHVRWEAPGPCFRVRVAGDDGTAVAGDDGTVTVRRKEHAWTERHSAGFPVAYSAFYRQVLKQVRERPTYEDAMRAVRVSRLLEDAVAS